LNCKQPEEEIVVLTQGAEDCHYHV
jgi:hypothetical protein